MNISSNLTNIQENETSWAKDAISVIFTTLLCLDRVLALITNGCTIVIIYMHRYDMLEISSNIFIGSLTLGDLLGVIVSPFTIASKYLSHTWGWTINCCLSLYLILVSAMINTVTLCVIAVDRLIFIVYPLQYHTKMPVRRAFNICRSIWVSSSLYILVAVSLGYKDAYDMGTIARACHPSFSLQGISTQLVFYPILIFVPVTVGCYIKVGLVALRQRNMLIAEAGAQAQPTQGDFRITKVMFNVISVYLLCTLVVVVTPIILQYVNLGKQDREIAFRITTFIWRVNTWLNPMIYAWKSEKFRRYVREIFNRNEVAIELSHIT